jgi:uncharacterized protein
MTSDRSRSVVAAAFDAWANGNGDFYQILADDVVWTITGSSRVAGTYRSREEFIKKAIRPIFERLSEPIRPTVEAIISEGENVVVLWSGHAVAKDGQPYDNRYCWVLQLEGDKVKEAVAFFDSVALTDLFERVSP